MTLIIAVVVAPFLVLTSCFAAEVFCGLKSLPQPLTPAAHRIDAVIIVPAHNEALVLPSTLEQLKRAAMGCARILLVADNCSDATAAIARELDVEVIERSDLLNRGKGFALDFARKHLEANAPEIIVIVDADCETDAGSIQSLLQACVATGRPCQATNLQKPAPAGSPAVQLSTFAFFIKNVVRQRALQRLAGRAHLLGTGMALPWPIFANADLATNSIVEDLKLGQELAAAGHAPLLIEQATVWSKAETDRNTLSQRRRWEGGFLGNALRVGPAMLGRNLARADIRAVWAAIDIMIPPFALLILLDLTVLLFTAAFTVLSRASLWPVSLLGGALALSILALIFAWMAGGSRFVSLGGLTRAPFYVAWKLPMYLAFARRGAPKEWQRTGRE